MLLLHISDIHFRSPLCQSDQDPDLYFREELVNHAALQASRLGDVDAILVTGDIAFKGATDEYESASDWLELLANNVGCDRRRIYIVPGNHDVDRTAFYRHIDARNAVKAIADAEGDQARETELRLQLANDHYAHNLFVPIANFNQFAAKYDCQYGPKRIRWNTTLRIDHRTVLKLYGLNSTLISGFNGTDTKGALFMSALQLNVPQAPGTVNLIMAHHPPEWMSDHDVVENRLLGAPNLVLFGHRHVQNVRRDVNGFMMFSAGSVNPDRYETGWDPAYNLIELKSSGSEDRRSVEIVLFQYHWQSNPNAFVAKFDAATGEQIFRHAIAVQGENSEGGTETPRVCGEKGEDMVEPTELDHEGVPLAALNVRDLIYRFWELDRHQRKSVLEELGINILKNPDIDETIAYRGALVELARQNRLSDLASAITEKEASS